MFQNVIVGWFARRVPELVGIITFLVSIYNALPPAHQATIVAILTGKGGGLTVTAVIGLAIYIWGQVVSYRATVQPQVVTGDAKKIPIKPDTRAASEIEAKAAVAPQPKTLWDRFRGR